MAFSFPFSHMVKEVWVGGIEEMSKESEDKKKFEKWQRMFYASSNKELNHLSKGFDGKDASMFEEFAFLAGLKAGREEWGKKTKDIFAIALEQEKEIGVFKDRLQEFHKNLRKLYDTSYVTYGTVLQLFISTFGKEVKTDGKA